MSDENTMREKGERTRTKKNEKKYTFAQDSMIDEGRSVDERNTRSQ